MKAWTCALALMVAALAAAAAAQTIGPYVQNVTQTSAVIHWATQAGAVNYGQAGAPVGRVAAYDQHELKLEQLKPGEAYEYEVPGVGKGRFTTAPAPGQSFTFLVYGDTRTRHDVHQALVGKAMAEKPCFVVNTGDLVSNGISIVDWEKFFEINQGLMRNVPYFPCLGNHERDAAYYFNFFSLPGNERYYSFDWGNVHVAVLDTSGPALPARAEPYTYGELQAWEAGLSKYQDQQLDWLSRDLLANRAAEFKIVAFHVPLWTAKTSRQEAAAAMRERFHGIFRRYGVDMVFNGHDHYYLHVVDEGVHHVITGGGGAPLYDLDAPPADADEVVKMAKIEHYVRVKAAPKQLSCETVDLSGKVIDSWVISK